MPLDKPEEAEGLHDIAKGRGLVFTEYTPIAWLLSETTQSISKQGDLL